MRLIYLLIDNKVIMFLIIYVLMYNMAMQRNLWIIRKLLMKINMKIMNNKLKLVLYIIIINVYYIII